MLKLFILNLSKFVIACFILAAGVFGFLWLKNTEDEVSVEKLEETSFFVQTQSVVFNNYNFTIKIISGALTRNYY